MDLFWLSTLALAGGLLAVGLVVAFRARRRALDRANPLRAGQRASRQLGRTARGIRRPSRRGTGEPGGMFDGTTYPGGGGPHGFSDTSSGGGSD